MKKNDLTQGKVGRCILRFALPFMAANLLQALYGAADLFVVGRYADSAAVSGVAVGSQVMQMITSIVLGISMGGTVLIGRRYGAKNQEGTARAIGTLAVLFCIIAAILTPVVLFSTKAVVSWMNTPAEAVAEATRYIFICACGIPFIVGYNAVSGIFRGLGDSRTPVFFIAIACVVNIVTDFVLVGALRMSAAGAAIATVAAQAISFIVSLLYMHRKGFDFPFARRHFGLCRQSARHIFRVGIPVALQDSLVSVSFLIITAIINTMGLVASASVGVVEKIIMFAMLPPAAFASAVATMTAQNIGAGKPARALSAMKHGIGYALVFGVAVCLYAQFLPETLTGIFSNDGQVVVAAAQYLRSYSIDCVLVCFVFNMNSYFSGNGRAVVSMAHSLVATFGVRVPLSLWFSKMPGASLYTIGFAAPAATLVSLVICLLYLRYMGKKAEQRVEGKGQIAME